MSTRVIVVGGGIVGSATAYFAAREGCDVVLLERAQCGYGASGRNPGFVWLHCRNPGFALDISRAGRRLYTHLVHELPDEFDFRTNGGLIYFNTPEQGAVFEEFVAARRGDGLDIELIDGAEVRRLVPPIRSDVLGASFCSEDAQINTPSVVRALVEGARREGAEVREHTAADELLLADNMVAGVRCGEERIEADAVVVATGAWSNELLAAVDLELPIGAERLQVVGTEPLPIDIKPVVYGPLATKQYTLFRDLPSWSNELFAAPYEEELGIEMLQLVAQRATGEVLMGCPMDYPPGVDMRPTLAGLHATARSIGDDFPGLVGAPVERVWAGALPYTTDMLPVIDQARPGLFIASGHVFGNAAGPMTGMLMAQLIQGRAPDLDLSKCRFGRAVAEVHAGTPSRW